jgi:hypothetical protein
MTKEDDEKYNKLYPELAIRIVKFTRDRGRPPTEEEETKLLEQIIDDDSRGKLKAYKPCGKAN